MDEIEDQPDAPVSFQVATDPAGAVTVTISGELDLSGADALRERIAPVLERNPPRVIVDVAGLRFADSSAIALWVRWATAAKQFELRDPSPLLREVIDAMGLTGKLAVRP
jgi:anti-sigma B factor antagonist